MHSYIFIIGLSVTAQLVAAALALRLVRVTGQRTSWILIAGALILMAIRRITIFLRWYSGASELPPDIPYELIGLAVSLLLAVGIAWIGPLFSSIKESERIVRENEQKYRGIFESVGDAIFLLDQETGAILDVNAVACSLYGYSREELLSLRHADLCAEPDSAVEAASPVLLRVPLRHQRRKDGTVFPVEITGSSFERDGRRIVLVSVRDISERLRLQEKVMSAERIMAIGRMAGGIAHRLNNMMVAVTGYSSLLLQCLAPGDPREKEIRQILEAGRRAAALTRQLLAIGRRQMLQPKEIDLKEFAGNIEPALRVVAGDGVALTLATGSDPVRVVIDPEQLERTLESLVENSREAGSGRVTIRVSRADLTDGELKGDEFAVPAGPYAMITVSDTGCGMNAETRSRLFSPFFTTKEGGEGLALASAYGFIKQSGGYVLAESEVGMGSSFTLCFPLAEERAAVRREEAPPPALAEPEEGEDRNAAILRGRGRILVMDDDEVVRGVAGEMLSHLGYDVLYARDGEEAIAIYRVVAGTGRSVDAVILDLTIPSGMGGQEAVRRLREIDPGLRAIVSSGYTDDPVMASFREHGFNAAIAKPYRIRELGEALRAVLGEGAETPGSPPGGRIQA